MDVYDPAGRRVACRIIPAGPGRWMIKGLERPGIYFLRIFTAKGTFVKKLMPVSY